MKKFLNLVTNNNAKVLKKPITMGVFQAIFQGQPYFIIMMVMRELLVPLMDAGERVNYSHIISYTVWLACSIVLIFLFGRATYQSEHSAAYSISSEGRLSLGDHLRTLSMGFFKGRDPGDITALMLQDYSNIETMISQLLMNAVEAVALPVVFLAFLIPFNWQMALITVAPVPLAILAAILTQRLIIKIGRKHIAAKNAASSRMLEYLNGIQNIKAFNLHGAKFERLRKSFDDLRKKSIRLEAGSGPAVIFGIWFLQMGIALIMIFGTIFLLKGSLSVPDFLLFLIIGTRMYDPLSKLLTNFAELTYYSISAGRIKKVYNTAPLPESPEEKIPTDHDIEFQSVRFHYHDTDVLKDVNFHLKANTMTALVGPSGSGKTTITRLIARFWDIDEGEIRIGGIPIREMSPEKLLSMVSIVFQDVYLFNDTILNNIKMGKEGATIEEVRDAAKKARCDEFIERLSDGYETMVGEGGATLSGGEKQRISIARAILKDAPIILLDEATASLDPENELYIQQAISELVKNKTLIVIAHRLSTITGADKILVLNEGKIFEQGTHKELLEKEEGFYQRMWNEQRSARNWKVASKVVEMV